MRRFRIGLVIIGSCSGGFSSRVRSFFGFLEKFKGVGVVGGEFRLEVPSGEGNEGTGKGIGVLATKKGTVTA